jgi:hypothetical protein
MAQILLSHSQDGGKMATMIAPNKRVAPYLPFATFLSSLDSLAQGVPPRLDRTLWRNQSGLMQGLIMNAYRFFGLVEEAEGDASNEYLLDLVKNQEQRPEILRALIEAQYTDILEGHDLSKMTMKMLEEGFEKEFSVSGATKQKAITFFLKAAKFAEMPLSNYLSSQLRNASPRKKRGTKQRAEGNAAEGSTDAPEAHSDPTILSHTLRFTGGGELSLRLTANPFTFPAEDRSFVFSIIDMLQKYQDAHPQNEEEEPEE